MASTVDGRDSADAERELRSLGEDELETLSRGLEIVAVRRLSDPEEAREAVQETLARTIEAMRDGRVPCDTAVAAFAHGIHSHVLADTLRERYRRSPGSSRLDALPSPAPSPLERLISKEERHRVTRALERLSASDRELLRSCYVEGRKLVEIAQEHGVPSARIRKRKSRALGRLREILKAGWSHDPRVSPTTEA